MKLSREQFGSNDPLLPQLDMGEFNEAGEQEAGAPLSSETISVLMLLLSTALLPLAAIVVRQSPVSNPIFSGCSQGNTASSQLCPRS